MSNIISWQESGALVKFYYLLVLLTFLYILYKNRRQRFSILIILLFFNGFFAFYGKNLQNAYRILLVFITLYWIIRTNAFTNINARFIVISFIFFTGTFLYTSFINGDYFYIIFSQYSRFFILFSLFFILKKFSNDESFRQWLENLIYDLLLIQIFLSIAKYIIIGATESIVGSVGSQGGAMATSLPILGFMFLWIKKKGKLNRNDWLFTLGLTFIGFVSVKRAIWFVMPILIAMLMFFVPKRKIPTRIVLFSSLVVPLIFYFGIRLNPSLNIENKSWGSFDLQYAINYAKEYSFGAKDQNEKGVGRGGATILLFGNFFKFDFNSNDWSGYGLRFIYAVDYGEFQDLNLGINHLGSATGAFQTMVSNGYVGIITLLWFVLSILIKTINKRIRIVLILFFIWEYFFYTGIVIRELSLSFLLIYVVLYSDVIKPVLNFSKDQAAIHET